VEDFKLRNSEWHVEVVFYDDANPAKLIPRTLDFPINTTKAQMVQKVRSVGAEVRAVSTLNADNTIIGSVISIP
jgi:hypothetical protein